MSQHTANPTGWTNDELDRTQQFVHDVAITAQDIAEVIAFAVSRPRRMTLNEILVGPTAQAG